MKKLKYYNLILSNKNLNLTKFGFSLDGFERKNRHFILNSKGNYENNHCHVNKAQILGKGVVP